MRGASALQELLEDVPQARLRALVVWEPVLWTDVAPPTSGILGLVRDSRAQQYWDTERAVSRDIVRAVNAAPARYGFEAPLSEKFILWDAVAVFPAGASWETDLPVPSYYGGPVVNVIDEIRGQVLNGHRGGVRSRPDP